MRRRGINYFLYPTPPQKLIPGILLFGAISITFFYLLFLMKYAHEADYEQIYPEVLVQALKPGLMIGFRLWVVMAVYELYKTRSVIRDGNQM
ncbi:MAG: hypothetical protein EA411_08590 [Saprospirales bacterium]|nr:MAG: hypothetical protein EA411_08590 [Saprospirales bacterium]